MNKYSIRNNILTGWLVLALVYVLINIGSYVYRANTVLLKSDPDRTTLENIADVFLFEMVSRSPLTGVGIDGGREWLQRLFVILTYDLNENQLEGLYKDLEGSHEIQLEIASLGYGIELMDYQLRLFEKMTEYLHQTQHGQALKEIPVRAFDGSRFNGIIHDDYRGYIMNRERVLGETLGTLIGPKIGMEPTFIDDIKEVTERQLIPVLKNIMWFIMLGVLPPFFIMSLYNILAKNPFFEYDIHEHKEPCVLTENMG